MLMAMSLNAAAQNSPDEGRMVLQLEHYFAKYKPKDAVFINAPKMLNYELNNTKRTLLIHVDGTFAQQEFTPKITQHIYSKLASDLPKPYKKYKIAVMTNGMAIENLVPGCLTGDPNQSRAWGDINYEGRPWVQDVSLPITITHGLQNRHLSVWASHGRYYDVKKDEWKWQRPNLFGTNEDLFTQTIVVPYLIPMLENAGAIVFTPRERDWQKNEVIVDNDTKGYSTYQETNNGKEWEAAPNPGLNWHSGTYNDGENPFTAGTARIAKSTKRKNKYSEISYQPTFNEAGRYAVYVSYQTVENSVDDAHYTVWHQGEKTNFYVNQQMGGNTWVYLGTFDFDKGCNEFNRVVLTNQSDNGHGSMVTADAVRFGGGLGNIQRGGKVSTLPRCLEGARYAAQWAGMPYSVYSSKSGQDDYGDDINTRSMMTNYLAGGSCYVPTKDGEKVPFELSLAIHSDAGYDKLGTGLIGSLAICTTSFNDGRLNAGISRMTSKDMANTLLNSINNDIQKKYGKWATRGIWDKNYSETRVPEVPSCIIETLSHQNFPEMMLAQDPHFRFTLARSLYKGILRYIADVHGTSCIVTPLAPHHFRIEQTNINEVRLRWNDVKDSLEETAQPTGYLVYTAAGPGSFDNGTYVQSNQYTIQLQPDMLYRFKVVAVNRGGKSFPTEELCALLHPGATSTVMIANAFHRLSAPAIRNTDTEQGFDLDEDAGVTAGKTAGWVGRQQDFDRASMGTEGPGGLGDSGNEMAGYFVAGNDFDYTTTHAEAIQSANLYNILSCSSEAIETGETDLKRYQVLDLILGLNRNKEYALRNCPTFPTLLQSSLKRYAQAGGKLIVSGSYIGTDNTDTEHQQFINSLLKCQSAGSNTAQNDSVIGMGTTLTYFHQLNDTHYAATSTDKLLPVNQGTGSNAFTAMRYTDDGDAAVAYNGNDYKSFTMGFPFECIRDANKRAAIMRVILSFLLKK